MEALARALQQFREALEASEHGGLQKYRKLETEAETLLKGSVVPEALAPAVLAYEAERLARARLLVLRDPPVPLRLRPYNLPWLLIRYGQFPDPPRAPTEKNLVCEVLDCMQARPELPVLLTDDYDDFCVSCINMSAWTCTKDFEVRLKDIEDNHAACRLVGVELGQVRPAKELLDLTAERVTDASAIVGGSQPDYVRGREAWLSGR